jgi:ribonuclease BN (tRNA processing enzyme)
VDLTILGSCGTWPGAGRATSGYLVRHDGHALWVDTGMGTFAGLQRHVALADVDAILVTHEHLDHMADLFAVAYGIAYGGLAPDGFPIHVPPGVFARLEGAVGEGTKERVRAAFDVRTLTPATFEIGPFAIEAVPMPHAGLTAFGFRIAAGGAMLAYTGDTGPGGGAVARVGAGADLLLAEAALLASDPVPASDLHLTAAQAAEGAAAAGAARLVLTHIRPDRDPAASVREAGERYDGPIGVAEEGLTMEVRS